MLTYDQIAVMDSEQFPDAKEPEIRIHGLEDIPLLDPSAINSDLVAVVSHPGWQCHNPSFDNLYDEITVWMEQKGIEFEAAPILRAKLLAEACSCGPLGTFLLARQVVRELELFEYLKENQIPTILTIPTHLSDDWFKKSIGEMESVDESSMVSILQTLNSREEYVISKRTGENYTAFIRELVSNSNNFYLLPTVCNFDSSGCEEVWGDVQGDYNSRNLQKSLVSRFLESMRDRTVLFAGSNLGACFDGTLGYSRFVPCKSFVLLDYCGIEGTYANSIQANVPDFLDTVEATVNKNPEENNLQNQICRIFQATMYVLEQRLSSYPYYKPNNPNPILSHSGKLTQLKLPNEVS